jgi:ornithine carbamoyltransferase
MQTFKKDLLSMADLSPGEIAQILKTAEDFKRNRCLSRALHGRTLGMIFQKPSTRTSVSFSVAMYELGGLVLTLNAQDLQVRRGESFADTAKTLSRYLSAIMIRAHRHGDVEELARHATIPVINGLTDEEHPCQVLADLQTVMEVFKIKNVSGLKTLEIAYVGDGNNMAHSWILAAGLLGLTLVVSSPKGYESHSSHRRRALVLAEKSGAHIRWERDPQKAVVGASVIYTDVWASMGQEGERTRRRQAFKAYQVNATLLNRASKNAVVMHCLPAHRGEEITESVLEGSRSVVFDQAENRLHVQKAVLLHCLGLIK